MKTGKNKGKTTKPDTGGKGGETMAICSTWHKEIDPVKGYGKCSVPMWTNGVPAGFCNQPAYGERTEAGKQRYDGYVAYLACRFHGGPREGE